MRDLCKVGFALGKPARSASPHTGSARYSILMPVPIVQQAHHERNLPFNRCAWFKSFNCEATTRPQLALLYWTHRRSDKGIKFRGRVRLFSFKKFQTFNRFAPLKSLKTQRVQNFKVQAFNDRLGGGTSTSREFRNVEIILVIPIRG